MHPAISEKALAALPDKMLFEVGKNEIALALKKYDWLLDTVRKKKKETPDSYVLLQEEIQLLCSTNRKEEALNFIREYLGKFEGKWEPEEINATEKLLMSSYYYFSGAEKEYASSIAATKAEEETFESAFALQKLAEAAKCLETMEENESADHFLLYLAAIQAKNTDLANEQFNKAVECLQKEGSMERWLANCLKGEKTFTENEMLGASFPVRVKRIYLAVIGTRFPQHQKACFQLAEKLNYNPHFPHLFLKKTISQASHSI